METPFPGSFRDLPPKWAHFCLGIERFMRNELGVEPESLQVLCAFSGGADSTALLLALHCLSLKNGGHVRAAHLDHGLRRDSGKDALWCRDFCGRLNIPFQAKRVDIASQANAAGHGIEETARSVRYDFLKQALHEHNLDWIATGHHLGDLSEDVVMRLVRGTGWPGLSGMPGVDRERSLMRPLLLTGKKTLCAFLEALGASWCEDETNTDTAMTRNRIRHSILPLVQDENPNFSESVVRLWRLGRIDEAYWLQEMGKAPSGELLPSAVLEEAHKALRLRLYKKYLDSMGSGQALADTLLKMDDAWREARFGAVFQFPGDRVGKITPKGVLFGFKD